MRRKIILMCNLVAFSAFLMMSYFAGFRINLTSSMPEYLWFIYPISPDEKIMLGDYVIIPVSGIDTSEFDEKTIERYFKQGGFPFLKQVSGVPGDLIDKDESISLFEIDSKGCRLPIFHLPTRLGEDEYWLTSDKERGFDSRYFGPVNRRAITAKAKPLF